MEQYLATYVIFIICIGLIPAVIADNKGRSFILWWIFGALAFIIALPAVLLLEPNKPVLDQRHPNQKEYERQEQAVEAVMSADDLSHKHAREEAALREKHDTERRELQLSQEAPRRQITYRIEQLEQEIAALTTNISSLAKMS